MWGDPLHSEIRGERILDMWVWVCGSSSRACKVENGKAQVKQEMRADGKINTWRCERDKKAWLPRAQGRWLLPVWAAETDMGITTSVFCNSLKYQADDRDVRQHLLGSDHIHMFWQNNHAVVWLVFVCNGPAFQHIWSKSPQASWSH
jgi:hypothetical protein